MIKEYDAYEDAPEDIQEWIDFKVSDLYNKEWAGMEAQSGKYEIMLIEFEVETDPDDMDDIIIQFIKVYDFAELAEKHDVIFSMSGESESVYFIYLRRNEMFPEEIEEATLRVSQHHNGQSYDHNIFCNSLAEMYSNAKLFLEQIPDQKVIKEGSSA